MNSQSEELNSLNFGTQNCESNSIKNKKSTVQLLLQRVYILQWMKSYNQEKAFADFIAGVTLGMTLIPQSIAYASLAGLSAQYGLYSSFVGPFIYVFLGSIPQVSIGPTSLMAILTFQYTSNLPVDFVVMLTFISGTVELFLGIFNFGFIINLISNPVTSAFTTATAAIVMSKQLFEMMGLDAKIKLYEISSAVRRVSFGDSLLGITCLGALLGLRLLMRVQLAPTNNFKKHLNRILWYVSISRNAIVVMCSSMFAYILVRKNGYDAIPFNLNKEMSLVQNSFKAPPFQISFQNETYSFIDICHTLGGGIVVVPIIAILANVAIAKAFVKDTTVDGSQEMFTLGMCNIAGSFFGAMPTCGAFTRSAVSQASGVKTPISGVYTGGIVLLALNVMTPYFQYIPKAALSAVLITAVMFMMDFTILQELWRRSRRDFLGWIVVFATCIYWGVEMGLFCGIIINLFFIVYCIANPVITEQLEEIKGKYFIHIVPVTDIYYTGATNLRDAIKLASLKYKYKFPILIDCKKLSQNDYTLIKNLESVFKDLQQENVEIFMEVIDNETGEFLPYNKIK